MEGVRMMTALIVILYASLTVKLGFLLVAVAADSLT